MLSDATVLVLAPTATFQPLGPEEGAVVLMTDSGQVYTCNDTTVALLEAVDGTRSFGEVVDRLHAEFEVERDVLASDLSGIIDDLEREGILQRVPESR